MAIYYIDPLNGNNSNDGLSVGAPKLTVPTPTSNNTYLLKRGTTYLTEIQVGGTAIGVTLGAYGVGPRPIINPGAASRWSIRVVAGASNCIVENLECMGAAHPTLRTFGIYWGSGTASGADGGILRNCIIHDFVGNSSGDCDGVQWFGDNGIIENCEIYNCADDGIWYEGLNPWIHHNKIYNVGLDSDLTGDCIQLNGTLAQSVGNARIEYNVLDHSSGLEKQCFIVSSASLGYGGVFQYNICSYPFDTEGAGGAHDNACVYSDQPGFSIIGNRLYYGTYGVLIDAGINQVVQGNLIVGAAYGMSTANSPTGLLVDNNTFIDCWQGGPYLSTDDSTTKVRNNIFYNCQRGLATHANITRSKNSYFKNTVYNWGSIAGGGTIEVDAITTDPMLTPSFQLKLGSPLLYTGLHSKYTKDIMGRLRNNPPSIGAYEYITERADAGIRGVR
jgi:hypothetical protein